MKKLSIIFTIALSAILVSSCTREDLSLTAPGVDGTWKGRYGYSTDKPSEDYVFVLGKDGQMEAYGNNGESEKGSGTYTIEGNLFSATYHFPDGSAVVIEASLNAQHNHLNGTWIAPYLGGSFFLDKQ